MRAITRVPDAYEALEEEEEEEEETERHGKRASVTNRNWKYLAVASYYVHPVTRPLVYKPITFPRIYRVFLFCFVFIIIYCCERFASLFSRVS